jgi:tetratricopeptide (TPR) repeat protein
MEMCYVKMKRFDKLWEILTRFDVLYPDNPSVTRRMAGCLVMQGKHAEALNYLYKLELTDQNDPTTLSQIAVSSAHIGRFDTARKYILKRQQAKKPLTKEERLMAGSVYFAEGDWAQALSMLEQADLAAYDSYEPALTSLGISIGDIRLMRDMIERGRKG